MFKNLVVITSVINTHHSPLNYGPRSVFSSEQRYQQTLKTIESCSKIQDKEIILIETSNVDKEKEKNLENKVDYYFNFNYNKDIKDIIDLPVKSRAEACQLLNGLQQIDWRTYDNLYKISGRYWLNENFKYEQYKNEFNVFKKGPSGNVGTALFKINNKSYDTLWDCINYFKDKTGQYETVFGSFFNNNYITLDKIGLNGYVSVNGNFIDW
jgi:hypothetical protein